MVSLNFNPPVIAHRGASAYAPENTLIAFYKAAQLGVKWIECDIMQSADGELVIFHDETLERTTNGTGKLIDYPFGYLRSLDAGVWFSTRFSGEKIPSFTELLDLLSRTNLSLNLEVKALPGQEEEVVKKILEQIQYFSEPIHSPILFSSFSLGTLQALRQYAPDCLLGMLLHEWRSDWESECAKLNCVSVHVNEEIISEESVMHIKSMDKKVLCYTVNNPIRARELFTFGVDAVFSDMPDKILSGHVEPILK